MGGVVFHWLVHYPVATTASVGPGHPGLPCAQTPGPSSTAFPEVSAGELDWTFSSWDSTHLVTMPAHLNFFCLLWKAEIGHPSTDSFPTWPQHQGWIRSRELNPDLPLWALTCCLPGSWIGNRKWGLDQALWYSRLEFSCWTCSLWSGWLDLQAAFCGWNYTVSVS